VFFRKVTNVDRLPIDVAVKREGLTDSPGRPGCPVLGNQPKPVTLDLQDKGIVGIAESGGGLGDRVKDRLNVHRAPPANRAGQSAKRAQRSAWEGD